MSHCSHLCLLLFCFAFMVSQRPSFLPEAFTRRYIMLGCVSSEPHSLLYVIYVAGISLILPLLFFSFYENIVCSRYLLSNLSFAHILHVYVLGRIFLTNSTVNDHNLCFSTCLSLIDKFPA